MRNLGKENVTLPSTGTDFTFNSAHSTVGDFGTPTTATRTPVASRAGVESRATSDFRMGVSGATPLSALATHGSTEVVDFNSASSIIASMFKVK